jgi:hypothetical protein
MIFLSNSTENESRAIHVIESIIDILHHVMCLMSTLNPNGKGKVKRLSNVDFGINIAI